MKNNYPFANSILCCLWLFMAIPALGETDGGWSFTYSDYDFTATITGYSGTVTDIAIPDEVSRTVEYREQDGDGQWHTYYRTYTYTVTGLAFQAFKQTPLTSVTIPSSVTFIDREVFYGCTGLVSVAINAKITSIPQSMFEGCSSLQDVSFPSSVTSIGASAYSRCSSLPAPPLSGITDIGDSAFAGCENFQSVVLGESVTSLADKVFSGCIQLTNVVVDCPVTLPKNLFEKCYGLVSVELGDNVKGLGNTSSDHPFYFCTQIKSFRIGRGVTSIPCNYFSDTIPGYGGSAYFPAHATLERVELPNILTDIGASAFSGCTNLTELSIPDSVATIGAYAFSKCAKAFSSLRLGAQVTGIGEGVFSGCTQLTHVVLDCPVTLPNKLFEKCYGLVSVELGDNVKGMGNTSSDHPFYFCTQIKSFRIGRGVTSIPWNYFSDQTPAYGGSSYFPAHATLERVELPNTLTDIGASAFSGCTNLTELSIPDSVATIGAYAFYNCAKAFSALKLGPQVTGLGEGVFSGCTQLTNVVLDCPVSLPNKLFEKCYGLVSVELGDNVQGLGSTGSYHPFHWCTQIKTFRIGRGVTSIPGYYFGDQTPFEGGAFFPSYATLEQIEFPNTLMYIGDSAFSGCANLEAPKFPDSLECISESAFQGCKRFHEVTIPKALNYLGTKAFQDCWALSNVWFKGAPPLVGSSPFAWIAVGARGHYPRSLADKWLPQMDNSGRWNGLIMHELSQPVLRVESADPAAGSLTLAWDDGTDGECVSSYAIYRGPGPERLDDYRVEGDITDTTWTDTDYWKAGPVLSPLNYWVVAENDYFDLPESNPVETRRRFGVFVGVSDYDPVKFPEDEVDRLPSCAAGATLFRTLAVTNGGVPADNAVLLTTPEETKLDTIRKAFQDMGAKMQPGDFAFGFISTHGGADDGGCLLAYDDDYLGQDFMADLSCIPSDATMFFAIGACESESMFQGGWDWAERSGFAAMCPANIAFLSACNWQESAWGMAGDYDEFETFLLKYGWQEGYANSDDDEWLSIREAVQYTQAKVRGSSSVNESHVVDQIPIAMADWVLGRAPQAPGALALDAPTGVHASQGTYPDGVLVAWNAVPGAKWYRVWRYSSSIGKADLQCVRSWTALQVFEDNCKTASTWKNQYYIEAVGPNTISAPSETSEGWLKSAFRDELVVQGMVSETASLSEIAEIGKTLSSNGQTLYACFVTGINPNDPNAAFEAKLAFEDGKCTVRPVGGEKEGRVYRVYGKKEMSDAEEWTDVTDVEDLEAEGWRFFRVGVELAE